MADPTGYTPGYSFSGFQANSPTTPLPAPKLDAELANVSQSIGTVVGAVEDVRRSDGALKNNIVTYDSLALALQLIFDPTDGQAVANAVAVAQAAATAASGSATAAGTSATNAAASAAAAAASAGSVNLSLYLSKAGNLAGLGNADTARANLTAMKTDGSDAVGRLARNALDGAVDWNTIIESGWYSCGSGGSANAPDTISDWLVHVMNAAPSDLYITQIAYNFTAATTSASSVLCYRRHSYNSSGSRAWTPWISDSAVSVGAIVSFATTSAPPGYVKLNGALLSRTTYAALWAHASASGNLVTEASWSGGNSGAFSSGDLSTTFRLPDARGEFVRAFDDSRGVDSGRVMGARQGDLLRDHNHNYNDYNGGSLNAGGGSGGAQVPNTLTGNVNGGLGGAETRPRNIPLLMCIKF